MATSNDGSMEIRLTALADGTTAEVRTLCGVFIGPDRLGDRPSRWRVATGAVVG
ncbi:hypothetical protein [Streptomyces albidochromogenes]|uniref:Uncharacterized protein n=1 Tax=Streptomyces albidochromogenes TaxID=329524 RepID=A0ABW6FI21_9ACTN